MSQSKERIKENTQLNAARSDATLFSKLFIARQNQDGDLQQFFAHKNQAAPHSLSNNGNLIWYIISVKIQ